MRRDNTQSARFLQIYDTLPPSAQQALIEKHIAPLLNAIPREKSRRILAAAERQQAKAAAIPVLDLRAKKNEVNDLLDDLEKDAKRSFMKDRSCKDELLSEVVDSLTSWLNDIWTTAYEHKVNFAHMHSCLLFSADVLDHISNARGGCKCLFTEMYVPVTIKKRTGAVVRFFELDGAHNIEDILLWIWRDLFLTMLASGNTRAHKAIPEMLGDIELILGWEAVDRVLYGGERFDDADDDSDVDCYEFESEPDSEYAEEGPCRCAFHADHWSPRIREQVRPLRAIVRTHLQRVFSVSPSRRLFNCLACLADDPEEMEASLLATLTPQAVTCADALVAALEIHVGNGGTDEIARLLHAHGALLRPRDAPVLQKAAIALGGRPRALRILEEELLDTARGMHAALRAAFAKLEEPELAGALQELLRLRAGSAARAERVHAYVDEVAGPGVLGVGNPMAFAAMMIGLPFGEDMEEPDPVSYLDVDRDDPDLDDLREEFRPRLKERFEGWVETGTAMTGGPQVLLKVYKQVVEWMPFLRGADVVDEMIGRLADRPSRHHVCDALDALAAFVKTQRKRLQIRAEKKRKVSGHSSAHSRRESHDAGPPPLIPLAVPPAGYGGLDDVD